MNYFEKYTFINFQNAEKCWKKLKNSFHSKHTQGVEFFSIFQNLLRLADFPVVRGLFKFSFVSKLCLVFRVFLSPQVRFPESGEPVMDASHEVSVSQAEVVCVAPRKKPRAPRAPSHIWTNEETGVFLSLMQGNETTIGYFNRMKLHKMPRTKANEEIASLMKDKGYDVNYDNKWKALLHAYRLVEDHNSQSGNGVLKDGPWHDEMAVIMGDKASTRPKSLVGSGLPPQPRGISPVSTISSAGAADVDVDSDDSDSTMSQSSFSTPTTPTTTKPGPSSSSRDRSAGEKSTPRPQKRTRVEMVDEDGEASHFERRLGLLGGEVDDAGTCACGEGTSSVNAGASKGHSQVSVQASKAKKNSKRVRASRARSSQILDWANKYSQEQKAIEEKKLALAEQHHADRMRQQQIKSRLLERLVSVLEKRAEDT